MEGLKRICWNFCDGVRNCTFLWWERDTDVCTRSCGISRGRDGDGEAGAGAGNAGSGVCGDVGRRRNGLEVFAVGVDAVGEYVGNGGS